LLTLRKAEEVLAKAECIYSADQVTQAIDKVAKQIHRVYKDKNPVVLCIMNGGIFTTSALMQRLQFPLEFDYIHVTRYRDATLGGELEWRVEPKAPIAHRHVLIVDDILDEGITLKEIVAYLKKENAADVRIAVLTRKEHDRNLTTINADYVGLEVPDRYVFGCGMDYQGYFRNLNGIYALPESD
jgi:hypoxanthine phosphoribosyltransferase